MPRGAKAAADFHANNTGLPYTPFVLKNDKDKKTVRVLQPSDQWVNLYIHQDFKKLNPTRCPSDDPEGDTTDCPLCAAGAPRTLRSYVPVRVRLDEDTARVQLIQMGREHLKEAISFIEDHGEPTEVDVQIKRMGQGLDTSYKWSEAGEKRALNAKEKALEIPDIEELIEVPHEEELERRAIRWDESRGAASVDGKGEGNGKGKSEPPF
jgi:hypothetical protein